MNAADIGWSLLRGAVSTLAIVSFFVLFSLRGIIRLVLRLYIWGVAFVFALAYFFKVGMPVDALIANGIFAFTAIIVLYKYDTLLQWLEPEGRTLFFDL